jgi:hypothetical protein
MWAYICFGCVARGILGLIILSDYDEVRLEEATEEVVALYVLIDKVYDDIDKYTKRASTCDCDGCPLF